RERESPRGRSVTRFEAAVGTAALFVAAGMMLTACGPATNSAYKAAFDKSFNDTFDRTMHDSCGRSATAHGAAADLSERFCSCVVTELDKLTVEQRMKLAATSPEVAAAEATCKARIQS